MGGVCVHLGEPTCFSPPRFIPGKEAEEQLTCPTSTLPAPTTAATPSPPPLPPYPLQAWDPASLRKEKPGENTHLSKCIYLDPGQGLGGAVASLCRVPESVVVGSRRYPQVPLGDSDTVLVPGRGPG